MPFTKTEYCQRRTGDQFVNWIKNINLLAASDEALRKRLRERAASDTLLNYFSNEAIPLSIFVENSPRRDIEIVMSADNEIYDALIFEKATGEKTEVQITTTENPTRALTRLHQNEYGSAPVTHKIETEKQLGEWKRNKGVVLLEAVDSVGAVEKEIGLISDRIRRKAQRSYNRGTVLIVYSYEYKPREIINEADLRNRILERIEGVSMAKFSKVYLVELKRTIELR